MHSAAQPSIQTLFGIAHPVIQAPMAGVQGAALAAAVSNAGGLGSLPAAMLSLEALATELQALSHATAQPYNVNFFVHADPAPDMAQAQQWRKLFAPFYAEFGIDPATVQLGAGRAPFSHAAADVLEVFRPAVVSFHFGLPAPDLMARVKRWGSKVLSSATTVKEAQWLEAQGVDAIIAQGWEAGGHRGVFLCDDPVAALSSQMSTLSLLPQIVASVKRPVIAAGGIACAAGVQAAFTLGAAGVQVGTAFLLCDEAATSAPHRAALQSEAAQHTALTNLFTGRPARGIVNRMMRELGALNPAAPAFPLAGAASAPLRAVAEKLSSGDFSPLWAGQNASGCKSVPAAQLLRGLLINPLV